MYREDPKKFIKLMSDTIESLTNGKVINEIGARLFFVYIVSLINNWEYYWRSSEFVSTYNSLYRLVDKLSNDTDAPNKFDIGTIYGSMSLANMGLYEYLRSRHIRIRNISRYIRQLRVKLPKCRNLGPNGVSFKLVDRRRLSSLGEVRVRRYTAMINYQPRNH